MICFLSAETLYLASDGKKSGQMKKINKFYIASLHLEEVFGFHCQVVSLTEELPSAGFPEISLQHLRRQLDAYQAAVTRLDDLLSADTLSPLSKQVIAANKERGRAWRRLNAFAKAMKVCPEASVAAAAGRAASSPLGRCRLPKSGRRGELTRHAAWRRIVCRFHLAAECHGGRREGSPQRTCHPTGKQGNSGRSIKKARNFTAPRFRICKTLNLIL